MFRSFFAALAAAAALLPAPFAHAQGFHAPGLRATTTIALDAPLEKSTGASMSEDGRLRVGFVRALDKAAPVTAWTRADGGFVTRIEASSPGSQGLRVKLELGTMPGAIEARVAGTDGRIETMVVDPLHGNEAWTAWTVGETQVIELFSLVEPASSAVRVGGVLHFTESPLAKAASACTLSTACSSNDPTYDPAITERKKSLMRLQFIDGGSGFLCSGTLIDTPMRPAAFVLTANHCIDNPTSANTLTTFWFFEDSFCGSLVPSTLARQVTGGMQLVFTNFNVDSTLLLMNGEPPSGAAFAPLNPALLAPNDAVVSVSHPRGDTSRYAIGTATDIVRDGERPIDMYEVHFQRGMIEGGSSGSGLYTMRSGHLELRGVLSQGALDLSCTNSTALTLYTRLEALYPEISQYIGVASVAPDDAPNRPQDLFNAPVGSTGLDVALDRQGPVALDNRRIDYAGDIDVYRFMLTAPHVVTVQSTGGLDLVGTIHNSIGKALEANDDANFRTGDNNFGMTRQLDAGTYYLAVSHWDPAGTGTYGVRLKVEPVDQNFTDLWWNPAESGWGLNINHQGNILFATLFTYDASGAPVWLVMSDGVKQADGSYQGDLYQLRGTPFSAASWSNPTLTTVGSMRIAFSDRDSATLTYTFNGVQVTKAITRQTFSSPVPTCKWSAFDRAFSFNFQDLWWNPDESGWGLNLTHQGRTLFATLFVYGSDGRPQWFVMSNGTRTAPVGDAFATYTGPLYRTTGPAFNAPLWTGSTVAEVGTLTVSFDDGRTGKLTYTVNGTTVTKSVMRQVFSTPATDCDS
jgi:lysyl endopeptidase